MKKEQRKQPRDMDGDYIYGLDPDDVQPDPMAGLYNYVNRRGVRHLVEIGQPRALCGSFIGKNNHEAIIKPTEWEYCEACTIKMEVRADGNC